MWKFFKLDFSKRFILAIAAVTTILAGLSVAQSDDRLPPVGQGSLLFRSPLAGRYESVPLLHTDVAVDIRGLVAAATVKQQYINSGTAPIEAVYIFPLPHDAAVYDLEIRIGNRVIHSEIHERAEAKRVYETAKSEGKRAALLEQDRPNIFTASVANIMPDDRIDVRLRYVQPLQWESGRIRLVIPMVVGPRYIPGTQAVDQKGTGWASDTTAVPDASRITPLVRNPEARPGHDLSLAIDLDSSFAASSINCVSHEVSIHRLADGRQRVELSAGATVPNKDFVLEMHLAEGRGPRTALFLSPGSDSSETHFLLAAFPPTVPPTERFPVEMLYMIDVSGSMAGSSIQQAREALLQALGRLRPRDRFGILAFNNSFREFAPDPLLATAENMAAAREYVQRLQAGGGTEMLPALLHLMGKPQIPGYLRHIVLLTDGDLGNEEEIFAALRRDLGGARLYTVAIGSAPNLFLATKMAQFGRGSFTHVADICEIQTQMSELFESIESPVLTDVKVSFEGVEVADLYPERPPDLFQKQPLLIFGRISKGRVGKVRLTANAGNETYETAIAFDASKATFHPGITTLWARRRVEELLDQWRDSDENGQAEIRGTIIAPAIRHRLVTRFTSLVAVEETVTNSSGPSRTVPVPGELPAGMQMDKVSGTQAPATGTADAFLETLGIALLSLGMVLFFLLRRVGAPS
jgi:Ca-activated chloride channel family protein